MKLSALAKAAGVSAASIKYYIHEGLLPPGQKKNATTAVYDETHLHRLALIRWLREELATPIADIAELTRAIDDESLPTIELMGVCQELALRGNSGLPASAQRAPGPPPFALRASGTHPTAASPTPDRFDDLVSEVIDRLGWPNEESAARNALARVVAMVDAGGYPVTVASIVAQCRAIAPIAQSHVRPISIEHSRDRVCLGVIRGITMSNRQLIAASALAHASLSMIARASDAVDGGSGGDEPYRSGA